MAHHPSLPEQAAVIGEIFLPAVGLSPAIIFFRNLDSPETSTVSRFHLSDHSDNNLLPHSPARPGGHPHAQTQGPLLTALRSTRLRVSPPDTEDETFPLAEIHSG